VNSTIRHPDELTRTGVSSGSKNVTLGGPGSLFPRGIGFPMCAVFGLGVLPSRVENNTRWILDLFSELLRPRSSFCGGWLNAGLAWSEKSPPKGRHWPAIPMASLDLQTRSKGIS